MSEKLTPWGVLRLKFPANEYVLIEEVSDASGFSRTRSLDYMLINLWNSRGLAITGIEQKSWRNDWLKELKNPKKQENHFRHCDYFYLLTDRPAVAHLEEIPVTWGWWHINESGVLKVMKQAPQLSPVPVDRSLMCAMLRRAADKKGYVHESTLEERIKTEAKNINENKRYEYDRELKELQILKRQVEEFEKALGTKITERWDEEYSKKIGAAAKAVIDSGVDSVKETLERTKKNISLIVLDLDKSIQSL